MSGRSREREECLSDILITAVEDGCLNGWRQVSGYRWSDERPAEARVTVHELGDGDETLQKLAVNIETIARGLRAIDSGEVGVCSEIREAVRMAQRDNDPCGFDAYSADAVLQAGLFGNLVYG